MKSSTRIVHQQSSTANVADAIGPCVHHFLFPVPNGPTVTGVCQKCGARQTVNSMGDLDSRTKFREKQPRTHVDATREFIERPDISYPALVEVKAKRKRKR